MDGWKNQNSKYGTQTVTTIANGRSSCVQASTIDIKLFDGKLVRLCGDNQRTTNGLNLLRRGNSLNTIVHHGLLTTQKKKTCSENHQLQL